MQQQLAASRAENVRHARFRNHLVAKVMGEWDRRRLSGVYLAWKGEVAKQRRQRAVRAEGELRVSEHRYVCRASNSGRPVPLQGLCSLDQYSSPSCNRLAQSSVVLALHRWRQVELTRAFATLRAHCGRRPARHRPQARRLEPAANDVEAAQQRIVRRTAGITVAAVSTRGLIAAVSTAD